MTIREYVESRTTEVVEVAAALSVLLPNQYGTLFSELLSMTDQEQFVLVLLELQALPRELRQVLATETLAALRLVE